MSAKKLLEVKVDTCVPNCCSKVKVESRPHEPLVVASLGHLNRIDRATRPKIVSHYAKKSIADEKALVVEAIKLKDK